MIYNDLCFGLPVASKYLLGVLNSQLMWWILSSTVIHGKDEVLRLKRIYMESLPVADADDQTKSKIESTVDELSRTVAEVVELEDQLTADLQALLGLNLDASQLSPALALDADKFTNRVAKIAGIAQTSEGDC